MVFFRTSTNRTHVTTFECSNRPLLFFFLLTGVVPDASIGEACHQRKKRTVESGSGRDIAAHSIRARTRDWLSEAWQNVSHSWRPCTIAESGEGRGCLFRLVRDAVLCFRHSRLIFTTASDKIRMHPPTIYHPSETPIPVTSAPQGGLFISAAVVAKTSTLHALPGRTVSSAASTGLSLTMKTLAKRFVCGMAVVEKTCAWGNFVHSVFRERHLKVAMLTVAVTSPGQHMCQGLPRADGEGEKYGQLVPTAIGRWSGPLVPVEGRTSKFTPLHLPAEQGYFFSWPDSSANTVFLDHHIGDEHLGLAECTLTSWVVVAEYVSSKSGGIGRLPDVATGHPLFRLRTDCRCKTFPTFAVRRHVHMRHVCPGLSADAQGRCAYPATGVTANQLKAATPGSGHDE